MLFFLGTLEKSSLQERSPENAKESLPRQKERSHLSPCAADSNAAVEHFMTRYAAAYEMS